MGEKAGGMTASTQPAKPLPLEARMIVRFTLIALLFTGCSDPYGDAQKLDTIAAYRQFVRENPKSPKRTMAEIRLEQLYLEKARNDKSLAAYDIYLDTFPKGTMRDTALSERRDFLMKWAEGEDTPPAWQKFLDEYPSGNVSQQRTAKRRLNMAMNRHVVEAGPVRMEQVNLAEDPEAAKNGYGFYVDFTNKGKQPIERLNVAITYLDENGKSLGKDTWPAVAKRLPAGLPFEEGFDKPIAPGETRTWEWSTGTLPNGWSKKVTVTPVGIRFVGE
jgi:hypothetical protein